MSSNCYPRTRIDVPFTEEEAAKFHYFLDSTGRKPGRWVRMLAIKAMDEEQSREGLRDLAKVENGGAA